jgi:hypothetical protein
MEAIRRHDSKRESSMVGRSSLFASSVHLKGVAVISEDIVHSPMHIDKANNHKEEDQEQLIRKSVPVRRNEIGEDEDDIPLQNLGRDGKKDDHDMDHVSLN